MSRFRCFALFLACVIFCAVFPREGLFAQQIGLGTFTYDFDGMTKRRLVRILVPYSKTIYFLDKGAQYGTAVDLGRELEKVLNEGKKKEIERIRIAFVPTTRNQLIPALNAGRGDIVMANLTITPMRLEQVDFAAPMFDNATEALVTGPAAPDISSIDDLQGKEVFVRKSSSYYEHLVGLNDGLKAAGKQEIVLHLMDENLEDEDLMEMVNAGLLPWTVVDTYKAQIWKTVFSDIRVRDDVTIATEGKIAWAIRKNSPQLKAVLDQFAETHKIGTTFGNMLRNRFYKSDKILKKAYSEEDIKRFQDQVALFRKHAGTYSLDYLMLIAQGYQESQLEQSRRSPRGAVGVMQLLPTTANDKAINIPDIAASEDRNIEAGTKYLRLMIDRYLNDPDLKPRDQLLFAFAAYNAGPQNLRKFRKKAVEMGLNPDLWFDNVENAAAEIVGRETVQYVGNIFKYYIAYRLLSDRMVQAEANPVPAAAAQ